MAAIALSVVVGLGGGIDPAAARSRPGAGPFGEAGAPVSRTTGRRAIDGLRGPQAPESLTGYVWPLPKGRLTQPFGPSESGDLLVDGRPFHDGIDIATWCGAPIRAAHGGTVLASGRDFATWLGWRGDVAAYTARIDRRRLWRDLPNVIVIDDGNGYRSVYVHLWRVRVVAGDIVRAGQVIGSEGRTGGATGCHLHYSLFSPRERSSFGLDPETAARRLLPASITARIDPLRVLPSLADGGIRPLPGESAPAPLILPQTTAGSGGR